MTDEVTLTHTQTSTWADVKRANKREALRKWRAENPDKAREHMQTSVKRHRDRYPGRSQEINRAYIKRKKERLAGRPMAPACEVCDTEGPVVFDHCHKGGHFRGWLCTKCNTALGHARDNPEILEKLAQYLRNDRGG